MLNCDNTDTHKHKIRQSHGDNTLDDPYFMSAPDVLFQYSINNEKEAAKNNESMKDDLPNESIHSWFVLAAVVLFNVIIGYHFMCFGVYYVKFTEAFDTTKATAGFIGSIHSSFSSLLSLFASVLIDLYGVKSVGVAGCLMIAAGIFTSALSPSIYMLYFTYGVLTGCGISFSIMASLVITQQHFHKHRNLATSLSVCGLPVGNIVSPIITNTLLDIYGWRGALFIHSGIVLNTVILALLFTPPTTTAENKVKPSVSSFFKTLFDFSLLKAVIFWPFMFGIMLSRVLITTFYDHTPSRAVFFGSDLTSAGYLISALCTGCLISRTLNSILMAFVNINPIILLSAVFCAQSIISFGLTLCESYITVVVCTFLFGCAQGFVVPTILLTIVRIAGVNRFSKTRAIANLFGAVGSFTATPLTGWMFDITGNYDIPFYFSGLVGLVSAICVLLLFIIYKIQGTQSPKTKGDKMAEDEFSQYENKRIRTLTV